MEGLWSATLNPHSPRYKQWREILGGEVVPLVAPSSYETLLGKEKDEVYLIAWHKMTVYQRRRLLDAMAEKFDVSPDEIEADCEKKGHFPIREADVIVAFSMRAFL